MVVMAQVVIRDVVVERVSVDRFVEQPTGIRREGETLVIPVFEEVPVVVIKTKLKEEVRVTTRTTTQFRRTPVEIRRETVTIERIPALSGDRSPHLRRGRTRKLVNIGPPIIALATGDTRTTIPRTALARNWPAATTGNPLIGLSWNRRPGSPGKRNTKETGSR